MTEDEKAAQKAADRRRHEVEAAIIAALLALRSKITTVIMWLPDTWVAFADEIGAALEPLTDAFDEAARSVWLGYDKMDPDTIDAEAAYRRSFVNEFVAATKRAIDKTLVWAKQNELSEGDTARVLEVVAGMNQNQAGAVMSAYLEKLMTGASEAELTTLLNEFGRKALQDRAKTVAGDTLWDIVMLGQLAAGRQEQRTTNAQVTKTWHTQQDERVCSVCGPLDGVTVPIDQAFPGGLMMPTAHSNCRCFAEIGAQTPED